MDNKLTQEEKYYLKNDPNMKLWDFEDELEDFPVWKIKTFLEVTKTEEHEPKDILIEKSITKKIFNILESLMENK